MLVRWGPWVHALLVGAAAAALLLSQQWSGGVWVGAVVFGASRALGWLVAAAPKRWPQPRRRGTVAEDLSALRREVRHITTAAHAVNNKCAVVVAEVDMVIARLDRGDR